MKRLLPAVAGVVSCVWSMTVLAGTDPVSWRIEPTTGFPSSVSQGNTASIAYTLTNHLPGAVQIVTEFIATGGGFSIHDHCHQHALASGASCTVGISYTPNGDDEASIQMVYGYNRNRIPLPLQSVQGAAVTETVAGSFNGMPPTFTLSNPEQRPTFTVNYTNTGKTASVTGYAGNVAGNNILVASPTSVATVAVTNNSCGTPAAPALLAPGATCQVQGQLTPVALGEVSVTGLFTYDGGTKQAAPVATSHVINATSGCVAQGEVVLPLPSDSDQYADNVVEFRFTNSCQTASSTLGEVSLTATEGVGSNQTVTINKGTDGCSNTTLAPQTSCTVLASVVSQGSLAEKMTVEAEIPSDQGRAFATTSSQLSVPQYLHKVTFVNQCPFNVWYGIANDNTTDKADPTSPAAPSDYLLPAQVSGARPATKTLTFSNGYNGFFFPRTGCGTGDQVACSTGQCTPQAAPNGGKCSLGDEPAPPYTKIEEDLSSTKLSDGSYDGVYDVSMIEGFNVPADMKGYGPPAAVIPFPPANNSSFQCTTAGGLIQGASPPSADWPLAACPWVVTPPSSNNMAPRYFNFVTDGDEAAGQNNCSCTADNPVCGIAYKASNPQQGNLIMSCGHLLGTWALKTLCTQPFATTVPLTDANDPRLRFNCDELISSVAGTQSGYTAATTLSDIYGCNYNAAVSLTNLNSCYVSRTLSTSHCCGAVNWNETTPYTTAQDKQFVTNNPDWGGPAGGSTIVPSPYQAIEWYKSACPTAYSYPFDDHSTSFYCKKDSGGSSVDMDYQVIFCPGGATG